MFYPMKVRPAESNPNHCLGEDEHGKTWEFSYVIPMDGPEYLNYCGEDGEWQTLPGWALPPPEVMEFFHGPLIQEPSDDSKALDYMVSFLSGNDWNADTSQRVVDVLRSTGRTVEDVPILTLGDLMDGASGEFRLGEPQDDGN